MAYSTSTKTLDAIRPKLRELEAGRAQAWKVEPGDEHRWARRVREALYIARLHRDQYPELASVASYFTVRVADIGRVEAIPTPGKRVEATVLSPRRSNATLEEDDSSQGTGETFGHAVPVVGLTTAEQLVASWLAHQPSQDSIVFQQTTLELPELLKLHRWANERTPKMMFFVHDGSITLAVKDAEALPFSWHPPEDEKPEVFDLP